MADRGWKFYSPLLLAALSFITPIVFWWVDLRPYSIELNVVSTTSLQPSRDLPLDGLSVMLAGKPTTEPYVSVLTLTNDGRRPITSDAFESSLVISAGAKVKISRAHVVQRTPASIDPKIAVQNGELVLSPLLLNPGDSIRFAVLTENGTPKFHVRARIADVSEVPVRTERPTASPKVLWTLLFIAVLFTLLTGALMRGFAQAVEQGYATPTLWLLALTGIAMALSSGLLINVGLQFFPWYSGGPKLLIGSLVPLGLIAMGHLFSRRAYVPQRPE